MPRRQEGLLPQELIERKIYWICGEKVMLDRDLAEFYGVKAIALRQQVKRNRSRFPGDFMFRLTEDEAEALVSQTVIPSLRSLGGALPFVFTEAGVTMLSSVLNSERAVQANIQIVRAFIRIRQLASSHKEILSLLNKQGLKLSELDTRTRKLIETLNLILSLPIELKRKAKRIGFLPPS